MKQNRTDIEPIISGLKVPATKTKSEAWNSLLQKIEANEKPRAVKTAKLPVYTAIFAAAAMIVLAVLFGIFNQKTVEFESAQAQFQPIKLPDNTEVVLKKNSSLAFSQNRLTGKRQVNLQGEAYFEVTKGDKFHVDFPGGGLTVLGTKFNVQAYSDKSGRIDCQEGSVRVEINQGEYILTAGKALIFNEQSIEGPFDRNSEEQLNIPDDLYTWTNRPLKEILTLLCGREGVKLSASERILDLRFTGTLNMANPKQALIILTRAMNLDYKLDQTKLEIIEKD